MNYQNNFCVHCHKSLPQFKGFSFMSTNNPEVEETLPFFCEKCFYLPELQVWLHQQRQEVLSLMRQVTCPIHSKTSPKTEKISQKTFKKIVKSLS